MRLAAIGSAILKDSSLGILFVSSQCPKVREWGEVARLNELTKLEELILIGKRKFGK